MIQYNIYFGTIGKTLGCKYRFSKWCKDEVSALKIAYNAAESLFFQSEGKYGIPTFKTISKESEITGISIEKLYKEHVDDMMRYYVIPTNVDTISKKNLK